LLPDLLQRSLRGLRWWGFAVIAVAFVAALSVCAQRASAASRQADDGGGHRSASNVVTDEVGRQVSIPSKVNRIVTLSPDLTETIYALGLDDKLAGDSNYCETPPAAKLKPHVGAPLNPSLEAIVALHPDLVLASTSINRRETVDALARLGIAVYASNPHTVRGMLYSVRKMSELMGSSAAGEALVGPLQARLDDLRMRLSELPLAHVFFVVWQEPLISIGQNTFIADALRWAGAESVILSDQNWPHISFEEVVRLQPDYIVFTSNHTGEGDTQLADLRARAGWKGLRAVESGNVVVVSDELARPSPGMVDAIEQLARELHPEAFSPQSTNGNFDLGYRGQFARRASLEEGCVLCAR
jgi:iron complex transport system substrate-binding protein